ncbi:MAG TPA: hypothetical protein DCZ13_09940 [Porticoccaceae bacterium]|nr:hypothetical protein [Porticoccaceae bacterium]
MQSNYRAIWQLLIAAVYVTVGVLLYSQTSLAPGRDWLPYALLLAAWALTVILLNYFTAPRQPQSENQVDDRVLQHISAISPMLVWKISARGRIKSVEGDAALQQLWSAKQLRHQKIHALESVDPELFTLAKRALAGEQVKGDSRKGDRRVEHFFFPEEQGRPGAFHCVSVDVADKAALRAQVSLAEQVFLKATEAIVMLDRHRIVTQVNDEYTRLTGYTAPEVVGHRKGFHIVGQPSITFYRGMLGGLRDTGTWSDEISLRRKSGELFSANMSVNVMRDEAGEITNYVLFFADLSAMKRTHQELEYQANHDNLTDLPNRRLFLDRLDQGIKRARRSSTQLAIFFIDLDNFKLINDAHGHHVGDEILKEVGRRLLSAVRQSDTVARLAGDEFTVITENVEDSLEVTSIAKKIMGCFVEPFNIPDDKLEMSASVGVGVYPEDGEDLMSLLKCADSAMYRAKAEGRNGFFSLSEGESSHMAKALFFPSELRLALKRGQMEMAYQPMHDIRTGQVVGCEGLLRWNHHCRGIIFPADFMVLAEEAGITASIGEWTLNEVCQQLQTWRIQHIDIDYLSINIAGSQVNDAGFAEMALDTLEQFNLSPSMLMLEISESVILQNPNRAHQFMRQLNQAGVRFCIDQFGSSHADFRYLRDLPVDTLKLDQRLLARVRTGKEDTTLIRALIGIGELLDKTVVAVGVERPGQEELLQDMGCQLAQGFLYAKPMTAESFGKSYTRPLATVHQITRH